VKVRDAAMKIALLVVVPSLARAERWAGVDESVVEKVAAEAGRQPKVLVPLEGDLLLFAFLCAGIVGGFALGYWYRALFVERRSSDVTR
jgi:hypothetical protein